MPDLRRHGTHRAGGRGRRRLLGTKRRSDATVADVSPGYCLISLHRSENTLNISQDSPFINPDLFRGSLGKSELIAGRNMKTLSDIADTKLLYNGISLECLCISALSQRMFFFGGLAYVLLDTKTPRTGQKLFYVHQNVWIGLSFFTFFIFLFFCTSYYINKTSVSETTRKPPLVKAQTALKKQK